LYVVYNAHIATSQPLLYDALNEGDPLDSDRYPVIIGAS